MKPANNAPIYACIYAELAEVARAHGYAAAIHGSLARDFDLILIPWIDQPSTPDQVIEALTTTWALRRVDGRAEKPHGRVAYTLTFPWNAFIDLQFMPTRAP